MKTYSTKQVARMIGIHWVTLHRWLADKKVVPSIGVPMDGRTLWRWTEKDVKLVRKYKKTNYRRGRGRKKTDLGNSRAILLRYLKIGNQRGPW